MNTDIEINGNMELSKHSPLEQFDDVMEENVEEKAVSKSQQRFFGMVDAYKKGELDNPSKSVKDAADGMSMKQVKNFAKTKHKGLPNHLDESVLRKIIIEALEQTLADKKPKYEMDNMCLQRYRRYGLTECLSDKNCTIILEKYGLSDIFTLNENGSENIFQKFRQPLANAINKIKNTFGNKACQFVSDSIKNAQLKGRSTLYGVLTVITLLSGTLPINAINTSDFEDSFQNNIMAATTNMTKERGITSGDELDNIKERAVDDFIRILYTLDDDMNNVYCASGVGCSENEHSAINLAKQDVLNNLKQKYGEDVIEKYGLEFKTIAAQSWQEKTFVNGKPTYKSYYTAIIAAYKTINSNNPIRECVHQALIKMLGKYTQGKVSSKEANKAIMDLANSSNQKNLNEE